MISAVTNDKINQTYWTVQHDQISVRLKQKKKNSVRWEAPVSPLMASGEERWSLSVQHHTRLPFASLGQLSLCVSYSISVFNRPFRALRRGYSRTYDVSMHGKRAASLLQLPFLAYVSRLRQPSDPSRAIYKFASVLHDRHAAPELETNWRNLSSPNRTFV